MTTQFRDYPTVNRSKRCSVTRNYKTTRTILPKIATNSIMLPLLKKVNNNITRWLEMVCRGSIMIQLR